MNRVEPLLLEPEAPENITTSRLRPAIMSAKRECRLLAPNVYDCIAGVQGGPAYPRRTVFHSREEALSTWPEPGMLRRGTAFPAPVLCQAGATGYRLP